ncbi:hypothetical protein QTJ16_003945 [Diplocarpon rosae]|uniref:Protein HIR n=1 Tax=Diplocarpon rosae TaxID=946125 RepID=A0AAD9SZX9_9HELO|nr:hypothetical protein QTJ16_003945 [Diplocarpon rosae]
MKIIKPSWLLHGGEQKDFEVYSCHVSSDGSRLATAAGDGHVRIWSTEAILHAGDPSYTKPKQLCHMSYHSGTIHTVRFSPNGRWLASGADDKIICIYALDTNPPSHSATFGSNEPPPVENWKIMKRLIGHDNDVQDLGWAYDSSILVSVGLDSKIVVWSGHTFEKLKTLSVHQSHVKGITFDPANKYFATASDDRSIKLFRFTSPLPNASSYDSINNFVLDHTIVNPFTSSPLTTYFRRCSWSPDGNHIAAANAVNGPVSSVAIINRGGWDSDINLIGHEGPTEVCTFSPRLFSKHEISAENTDNSGYSTQPLVTVIACAGQDKTLSIWNTSSSRPLVVLQDLAGKSISDLAWTPDGLAIFATSLDGSIVALQFEGGELGFIAPWAENDKALQKFGAGRRGVGVVEDVAGLRLEEMSKAGELQKTEGRMGALMGDASTDHVPVLNGNGTSTPMVGVTSTAPVVTNGRPAQESPASSAPPPPAVDPNAAKLEAMKSRVTITKDGKKRVAPLLVSSSGTGLSSLPQSQLMAANSNNAQNDAPQSVLDLSKPYDGLPRGGLAAMLLGNKRKAILVDGEEEEEQPNKRPTLGSGPVSIMVNGVNGLEAATAAPPMTGVVPTPEYLRPAVLNPSLSISQVRLSVPKIRSHILRSLDRGTLPPSKSSGANATNGVEESAIATDDIILEAQNPPTVIGQVRDPSRISASKRGATIWHDYLPRAIILVTGNKNLWAAACEDGSIYTWSPAGRRTTNAMVLEAQPVILECRGWWLLCITAVGMCYVWNLKTLTSPHPPVSLAPILEIAMHSLGVHTTSAPGVTSAHLNSTGRIIVTLSNGDGYLYSPNMYVWQRLSEAWWAVGSQYWNSNDSSISSLQSTGVGPDKQRDGEFERSNISAGIIPHLERHTTNEVLLKGRAYTLQRLVKTLLSREGFEGFESGVSIAHLENRVAAAMQLDAREEFRIYLFMYAKRLGAEGLKAKVEELLRSIMGGILKEGGDAMEESEKICGWDRKELLKEVVLILVRHVFGQFKKHQFDGLQENASQDMEIFDSRVSGGFYPWLSIRTSIHRPDPIRWLEENSDNRYAVPKRIIPQLPAFGASRRPKAALISLVRNSELKGILQSMQQLEYRWNRKYQIKVHYFCDIDYDVFRFMRDNKLKYGFNINILDDARSFPSLWARTRAFAAAHANLIHPDADLGWLLDPKNGGEYNNCQFFSNFEIGSLNFWRGEANEAYFNWLDRAGGFYYERFGDAPVHTLSVAMFVPKSEVWFFRDVGYQHDINHHCPPHREGKCSCEPTSLDADFYKLVPLESPQKKPADTCIRQFLGGEYLKKVDGWTMAGEKAFGGDGYHGYQILGDE